ncbi:MAG: hypothetical protein PW790_10670 [Parvibaculaceae bacterium]|nr:hypothetical protein [Parvibaculaceae bacterium]
MRATPMGQSPQPRSGGSPGFCQAFLAGLHMDVRSALARAIEPGNLGANACVLIGNCTGHCFLRAFSA